MEVTPQERDQYFRYIREQLTPIAASPTLPTTLWHYTSGNAAIKIIQEKCLWATQAGCVNDHMELKHAILIMRASLMDYRAGHPLTKDEVYLFDRAMELLTDDTTASYWFITSFSEADDDLSQWRAYGEGEGGYALGFDASELHTRGIVDQSYLAKVNYTVNDHVTVCRAIAAATFDYFRSGLSLHGRDPGVWAHDFLKVWGDVVAFVGPVLKNASFSTEKEWRIVRGFRADEFSKLIFMQRRTLMSRHLPLSYPPAGTKESALPITDVIVGPSRNNSVSLVSMRALLQKEGMSHVRVRRSDVPFQAT